MAVEYETFITADALVGVGNNSCITTSLVNTYSTTPLPIGHQNRHDGGDGGWLRMCSLSTTDVGFWIDEDQYANAERSHTSEAGGAIVFSRAFHAVFGGPPPTPTIEFTAATASVAEDGVSASLDVSLSAAAATDVTIDYQTADGTASAGSDYTATSDTITILQGQTTGTINVAITDDGDVEVNEDFTVTLSNPQGADLGANIVSTVTIIDDDTPVLPTIQFQLSADNVAEDAGSISLDVSLSAVASSDVSIDYASTDATATADADYTAVADTLTILQGQTTGTIVVPILVDDIDEADEDFTITLDPVSLLGPAELGTLAAVTISILDDDLAGIDVAPTTGLTTAEDAASPNHTASFSVVLTSQPQAGATVSIPLASGDTSEGVPSPTTVVFDETNWNTPQTVTVTGQDDLEDDGDISYSIQVQPATSVDANYDGLDATDVSVINLDDEVSTSFAFFDQEGYGVQEGDGLVTITVRLQSSQPTLTEIDYTVTDSSADWQDYTLDPGRLQFLIGEVEKTFTVEVFEDSNVEFDEHVDLELRNAATGELLHTSTVTIYDDDHDAATLHRVVYSVGADMGNLLTRPARAQITWSVASFDVPIDPRIGVGDIVTTDTDRYIVTRRNNDYQLEVRSLIGHECEQRPLTDVVSIARAFNSLADAVTGAADVDHLGTVDLVGANLELELACYADGADTQPVTVSGWSTGIDNTIRIFSPVDEYSVGVPQRGSGVAGELGAGLDVVDGDCLTLEHGDVIVEGLELSCTGSNTTALAGIRISASATGEIQLSDNLIALQPSGTADRMGIVTEPGAAVSLKAWNNVVTGIGDGSSAGHVGMLIDGGGVNAILSANTVSGGNHGIRVADAAVIAANNLVNASIAACFFGTFDSLSHHNLSSDATAPGSDTVHSANVAFSQPTAGDHHLVCDPGLGWAEISTTPTNDHVEILFDGDPFTPYHSDNISPAYVQFAFPAPQELEGIKIALGWANHHRWMLAAADTVSDMETASGSYTVIVPWRDTYPPDPQWDQVDFATPLTTSVLRLIVDKMEGDYVVHIGEVELLIASNDACDTGADLSLDEDLSFTDDIDELTRLTPWDVGADEGDPIEVGWSTDWFDATEEEGSVEIELELTRPSSFPVTVYATSNDGGATVADGDYVPVSTIVTFAPGEVRATVPVTVLNDGLPEDEEVFQVILTQAGAAQLGNMRWANIRVNDERDLPAVNLTGTVSYSENTAWLEIPVSLEFGMPEPVVVEYTITDQTAIEGSDYRGTSGALVFSPWDTGSLIRIRNINDEWLEPDETFLVEISALTNAELGATASSVVTILNDDVNTLPTVGLSSTSLSVNEGAGTASVLLLLSEPAGPNLSVNLSLTPQTATPVADYTDVSGSYQFTQGASDLTIDIPIVSDSETETNETVLLQLGNPSAGLMLGSPTQATLTILDDDGPPQVSLATATAGVFEVAGAIDLTVVLDRATDVPVDVQVDTADGTAIAGSDYTAVSQVLTIPATQTSGVVTISVADDGLPEDDETFTVALSSPSGADLGVPSVATVTILGDASLPSLSFASATYSVHEHEGPAVLDVVLDEVPTTQVTVQVTSADGTAVAGDDFTAIDEIVTFGIGVTSKAVVVEITDDATYEAGEDFTVSLSSPLGANIGIPAAATVTINPSDWPPFVYLADGGSYTAQYSGFEHLGQISIPVRLSDPSAVTAEIDYATSAGTATPGADYTETSGTIVFNPGETEHLIVIPIADDGPGDNGETFNLTLSNPVECTLDNLLPDDANVTVYDDAWVHVTDVTVNTLENAGTVVITVERTMITTDDVSVDYTTTDGTATAGTDYTTTSGTLVFQYNNLSQQIQVPLTDNPDMDGDKTFSVILSNAVNLPLGTSSTLVTIVDDETPEIAFSSASFTAGEEDGQGIATVTMSFEAATDITVDYATANDSATGGSDFTHTSGTLTIQADQTSGSFTVPILDDSDIEGLESLTLTLGNPSGPRLGDPAVADLMIEDDELRPVIGEPTGRYYGDGDVLTLDASQSAVPAGYQTWFAVLRDDGSDPMDLVQLATGLTGSLTASDADPAYRVRLVIALPASMPLDDELRGSDAPCLDGPSNIDCVSTEVVVTRGGGLLPFELAYAFPDEVMLRFGSREPPIQRSSDGGQTWQQISSYDEWWEESFFIDTDVEQGVTYYYRSGGSYLGQTTVAPGQPVEIPVWDAARVIPLLDNVTWHCPQYARRYFCDGTLHMRLQPETDQSLSGSTIRVFMNEETHQRTDGNGEPLFIDFPTDGGYLRDFVGYDVPGCVVRKATPDLEIQVPVGHEEVAVDLDGILFGANSLRFEVEAPNGDISERAILISVLDQPAQASTWVSYPHFVPVLFGTQVNSGDVTFSGKGPAGRNSPDCVDGDSWYAFNHFNFDYNNALYFNKIFFAAEGERLIWTDENGSWSEQFTGLADGTYNLQMRPAITSGWDEGNHGRDLLRPEGGFSYGELGFRISSTESSSTMGITIDSTITDLEPAFSHVIDEVLIDAPEPEVTGTVRFRLTDADQNLDLDTVQVYNCSLESCTPGQPGAVPYQGFYAKYQWDATNGHYGWFLVDLPLSVANSGVNELRFCAEDASGNPLGTVVEPCVSSNVTRTSPAVFAVISDPPGTELDVRPGEIVPVDGTASSFPGGIAFWTVGEQYYSGGQWVSSTYTPFASDPSELVTNVHVPTHYAYWRKARLVVAASEADLPADIWPDDGSLPCSRSEGEGRCDSAEFTLASNCTIEPELATVVMDHPLGSMTVGPEEEFQLQSHVTSPAYTFAYRWSVYDADDAVMRWPIATLGYDDAGEGFSLSNNDLTVTAAGQGLPPGDYLVKLEARYPVAGCANPWFLGSPGAFSLRVGHTIDGVAPGQVIEGGGFRVYSRTWNEGETGWVFIDEDIENPPGELMYSGVVQQGGFIQITPDPVDLPAIGERWWISLGTEEDGSEKSTWINALEIVSAGDVQSPLVVTNEEDPSCGGLGTECAHWIIPGQTWQGEWGEVGDEDQFTFVAGAGTVISITLDRVDLTLPPQHPDVPVPEIHLAGPDNLVIAASEPLALDATGATLSATLTLDGKQAIVVRTSKGTGEYLVTLSLDAEGGTGQPAFGLTPERIFLTTTARPNASLQAPLLDPFGNPMSGASVSWEEGTDCGMGTFCGNDTTTTLRSSIEGYAVKDAATISGEDQLWKPSTPMTALLKQRPIARDGVFERVARARAAHPALGRIRTSDRALVGTTLVDPTTAMALKAEAQRRAAIRGDALLKDGPNCRNHDESCPNSNELVFRSAQLELNSGDELINVELRILENGEETETLEDYTILDPIPLTLEIEATVRNDQGAERQVMLTEPAGLGLSRGTGGAISDGTNTCSELEVVAGPFTYLNARDAAMHQTYTEPDGTPCCYQPTEFLEAAVVVDAEVDDGEGEPIRIRKRAHTVVESIPQPDVPCELRPWPPGFAGETALIAGTEPLPLDSGATSTWAQVFNAYAIDACGNLNYLAPTDPQITATLLNSGDPELWADVVQSEVGWQWDVFLRSTHCTTETPPCDPTEDYYFVPDGLYDIQLNISSTCGSPNSTYEQSIDIATERPRIRLIWEQSGLEPEPPMASPGSALRNPNTGEVIAWRVKPGDRSHMYHPDDTIYTDIPVKLYVAENRIWIDADGNVTDSYRKVDDAEICVGQVHWHHDPEAYPDPSWDVTTTTCDQVFTGETTVLAYTEPEWPTGFFDGYTGVAAGITKVPDQGGTYYLVAEPLDEDFRRGDAWHMANDVRPTLGEHYTLSGTSKKRFEVGGGMLLDEDYSPVDPFIVSEPVPAYLMVDAQVVKSSPPIALLSTFDQDGEPVASEVQVSLVQAWGGSDYYAEIQLQPDGVAVSAEGGVSGETKSGGTPVSIGFGLGRIEATVDDVVIPNGTVFPGLLGLRFLTRSNGTDCSSSGYTPGTPEGSEQQTNINSKESNFAETVCVEIRAMHPDDSDRVFKTDAEVGLIEMPNDKYSEATQRFYDGRNGSTLLNLSGTIDDAVYSLEDGTLRIALHSSARARIEAGTDDTVVNPPYSGLDGAIVVPIPIHPLEPTSPVSGGEYYISNWVDERAYSRTRGLPGNWSGDDGANETRDWLEKMVWDTLATFDDDGTGEVDDACNAVLTITESIDPEKDAAGWVLWSEPDNIYFDPTKNYIRFRIEPDTPRERSYFSLAETLGEDFPALMVLHEARHVWQVNLTEIDMNVFDSDVDRVFWEGSIGDAPLDLLDSPNIAAGGDNPDGHFFGDAPGSADEFNYVRSVHERNAMRFTYRLGLAENLACDLGLVSANVSEVRGAPGSIPSPSIVVWVGKNLDPTLGEGVTVEFTVCDSNPADGCGVCDAQVRSLLNDEWGSQDWFMTGGSGITLGTAWCQVMIGNEECTVVAEALQLMAPQNNCAFSGNPIIVSVIPE